MEVYAAGIDNMSVESLGEYLKEHWLKIKEQLVTGQYNPDPVKRVEIPKPSGGMRKLGIPTVLDRLIQQGIYQILSPIFGTDLFPKQLWIPGRQECAAGNHAGQAIPDRREEMGGGYGFSKVL